jgi:DNA-binding transcriptional MerR regulator
MHKLNDPLIKIEDAAEMLSISPNTLRHWRWEGTGPKVSKVGRLIRYRLSDLENFVCKDINAVEASHG